MVGGYQHQCVIERYPSGLLRLYRSPPMGAQHNEWYAARSMVALADGGDVVEMDDVLMARARSIRDRHYGPRITYSPKVFSPVTLLC